MRLSEHEMKLVRDWIRLQYTSRDSDEYMYLIDNTAELSGMIKNDYLRCLDLCLAIADQDSSDFLLANLGAGLIEDLLVVNGARIISKVEASAKLSRNFRIALSMAWQRNMSSNVWERVQAAAGNSK